MGNILKTSHETDIHKLLAFIDQSYKSAEVKADPNINAIFVKFNKKKERNLSKALIDLKSDINLYQYQHNFKGPKFFTRIVLDISKINSINEGVGSASFLSNLWF